MVVLTEIRRFFVRYHIVHGMIQNGLTALYLTALNGHVALVRLLLEKKANVNICDKVQHFICSEAAMDGGGGG